jgi:hypothetical protein
MVLRRAYGDWRQQAMQTKELATAGFELRSTVRLSSNSKNLADMQMVVDAMTTLMERNNITTYVLISGDRDFAPLIQALQKRGKLVIGVGVRHATSRKLAGLCDHFIFYDELAMPETFSDKQLKDLIERALNQLLQDKDCVAASLLKQRMQSLSKGNFSKTSHGKRNFRKLLSDHPGSVYLRQDGTTLYICRPGSELAADVDRSQPVRQLTEAEIRTLFQQSLGELLADGQLVRASLLKQRMCDLSGGAFDETQQGDKNFRQFLGRYQHVVRTEQEGSTLYVGNAGKLETVGSSSGVGSMKQVDAKLLLQTAVSDLLSDQPRVRASLLKQHMQALSNGQFDDLHLGAKSFRRFLENHSSVVQIQQKGTTLLVSRSDGAFETGDLHLRYRSALKSKGLRVIPSVARLRIVGDIVHLLSHQTKTEWRQLINHLVSKYRTNDNNPISRSYVNDILRVSRRAGVVRVQNGGSLATASVQLHIDGNRLFQDAVMQIDATYLREIESLDYPFNLEEAAIALYETADRARYLNVILSRISQNSQVTS